jgi:hypothetical protein
MEKSCSLAFRFSRRFCLFLALAQGQAHAVDSLQELRGQFSHPPGQFRTMPFFVWNGDVNKADIDKHLAEYKAQGIGGFFVHPRVGLITPYLSERWFEMYHYLVDQAKRRGMQVWIYDENPFPSGVAGGLVPAAIPESYNEGSGLVLRKLAERPADAATKCKVLLETNGSGCNCFEVVYYRGKGERGYVDLIHPGVTEKFIEITMRGYERTLGREFGKTIPGIFTDEPNIAPPDSKAVRWTPDFFDQFQKRRGYDVQPLLLSMFEETGDWRKVRHDYNLTLLELFIERWSKPWYEYSSKQRLQWTGHYWDHGWPGVADGPDNMAMYAWHQLPGVDLLFNQFDEELGDQFGDVRIVKELSSVANQFDRNRSLSETYGGSGWELRFEDMKRLGEWEYVLGVNFMNQHLTYQTLAGVRKYDWPQSFGYQDPWWKHYHVLADYFARLSLALSSGEQVNRTLILEPTTTAWMVARIGRQDDSGVAPVEREFRTFLNRLETLQAEYDLGCENIIKDHGRIEGRKFVVGKRAYEVVVIPPGMENLEGATVELLSQYLKAGGLVLSFVEAPHRVDGAESSSLQGMAAQYPSRWLNVRSLDDPAARENLLTRGIQADSGKMYHLRRKLKDGELLFFVNSSLEDSASATINLKGRSLRRFDALTGATSSYPARGGNGRVTCKVELSPAGSLLLATSNASPLLPINPAVGDSRPLQAIKPLMVKRPSPNVLKLDYCDLKLGDKVEEDLPIHQAMEKAFQAYGFQRDPWWGTQFKTEFLDRDHFPPDSGFEAVFHFQVEKGGNTTGMQAVVERSSLWQVRVNGVEVKPLPGVWWLDTSFGVYEIGSTVRPGKNQISIKAQPMSVHAELQPVYLLGDFGVSAQQKGFQIAAARDLTLGEWKRQGLPFYSDVVSYRQSFQAVAGASVYQVQLGKWMGTVAEVKVNGQSAGIIGWPPYRLDVTRFIKNGENEIEVLVFGSLKNVLGPHHGKFKPGLIGSWLWRTAPEHTPPGSQYDLIGYGLFEEFRLIEQAQPATKK